MVDIIRDLSSRGLGVRATIKVLRTVWGNTVPAIDTYFTQGLVSTKKLMDAAGPAVAESGGKPKKIKTVQELWKARPDLKEASLLMAKLVKENPKMTKAELHNQWEIQRGVHPETSGFHIMMESNSLFFHGYLSMKILKEYANGGNRKASSILRTRTPPPPPLPRFTLAVAEAHSQRQEGGVQQRGPSCIRRRQRQRSSCTCSRRERISSS
jgi:hypothetical protein